MATLPHVRKEQDQSGLAEHHGVNRRSEILRAAAEGAEAMTPGRRAYDAHEVKTLLARLQEQVRRNAPNANPLEDFLTERRLEAARD